MVLTIFCSKLAITRIEYKKIYDDNSVDDSFSFLNYSEDCKKIVSIKSNSNYYIKDHKKFSNLVSKCNLYLNGKKVKDGILQGTDKVLDISVNTGKKVKNGFMSFIDNVLKW